jgi:hypothetical protein
MARIIKGQKTLAGSNWSPPPQEAVRYAEGGRIIDKEFYRANLLARDILKDGEHARRTTLEAARKIVTQTKEEASADRAAEAFNEASRKAIEIFSERIDYLSRASTETRALANEIVHKILGSALRLDPDRQNRILDAALRRLRGKRKLLLQCNALTLEKLQQSAPKLLQRLEHEPDIELQEKSDIGAGYFRIVTDAGSALCHQSAAIAALEQRSHD